MRILLTGSAGMVGRALAGHCAALGDEVFAHDRHSLDITNPDQVAVAFDRERPEAIINCAAWTDVDACESAPQRAHAIHAGAVETLARNSRRHNAAFVTISTDYVFDGEKEGFYTQRDDPHPQGVYAVSKLAGERLARDAYARAVVARTSWVFGHGGSNFLSRVVDLARAGQPLKAINDAYGTPTYASHLAGRVRELAARDLPGVYHVTNSGAGATFEEFARAALAIANCSDAQIESVSLDSLRRPAPRPRNSRLRCLLSEAIGLAPLPDWQAALTEFIAERETRSAE